LTSPFPFSGIVVRRFRFGATMELERSGRPMLTSASPGRGGGGAAGRAQRQVPGPLYGLPRWRI
jgi:hypothetical protein